MSNKYFSYIYVSGYSGEDTYDYIFPVDGTFEQLESRVREELQGFDQALAICISGGEVLFEIGEVSDFDVDRALDKIDQAEEGEFVTVSNKLNY